MAEAVALIEEWHGAAKFKPLTPLTSSFRQRLARLGLLSGAKEGCGHSWGPQVHRDEPLLDEPQSSGTALVSLFMT